MEIVLLLAADEDLQAAFEWVGRHREGRGEGFISDVDRTLDQLRQFPRSGKVYRGRYRRLLIPKYPFGIFYVVETDRVVIL
jgi:plasmid stabilization system protein ParE